MSKYSFNCIRRKTRGRQAMGFVVHLRSPGRQRRVVRLRKGLACNITTKYSKEQLWAYRTAR